MTITTTRPASDKQVAFIERLLSEKDTTGTHFAGHASVPALTSAQASQAITELLALPSVPTAEAEPGFYVRGEQAFKVQTNKAGTHTYALVWSGSSWDYQPGAGRSLAGLVPMTAEQAAALGLASGRCINCCRALGGESLSAKVSALIGYGETCARHNGWPYPKGAAAQRAYVTEHAPATTTTTALASCGCEVAPGWIRCTEHSLAYQNKWGRAENE